MFDTLLESRRASARATSAGALSVAAHATAVLSVALLTSANEPITSRVIPASEHIPLYAYLRFDWSPGSRDGSVSPTGSPTRRGHHGARRAAAATRAALARLPGLDLVTLTEPVAADITRYDRELAAAVPRPLDFAADAADRVLDAIQEVPDYARGLPTLRLPVEVPAVALASNPRPEYPEELRESRVEGDVRMQFLVDTTGAPDLRSARVLRSTNELFTAAVRSILPRLRFLPAESGGNKVAVVAEQTFSFVLR